MQLRQPDDNTLVIEFEKGGAPVVLKQSAGDFICSSEGLSVPSSLRSIGIYKTTFSRSFRHLEDGALLMKLTTYTRGVYPFFLPPFIVPIPIPNFGTSDTSYVRWPALAPDQESKPAGH